MRTVVIVILCLLYVISPIDLIPDFIPILGWIDFSKSHPLTASPGFFSIAAPKLF